MLALVRTSWHLVQHHYGHEADRQLVGVGAVPPLADHMPAVVVVAVGTPAVVVAVEGTPECVCVCVCGWES